MLSRLLTSRRRRPNLERLRRKRTRPRLKMMLRKTMIWVSQLLKTRILSRPRSHRTHGKTNNKEVGSTGEEDNNSQKDLVFLVSN